MKCQRKEVYISLVKAPCEWVSAIVWEGVSYSLCPYILLLYSMFDSGIYSLGLHNWDNRRGVWGQTLKALKTPGIRYCYIIKILIWRSEKKNELKIPSYHYPSLPIRERAGAVALTGDHVPANPCLRYSLQASVTYRLTRDESWIMWVWSIIHIKS